MIINGSGPYDERFEAIYRKHYARVWRYFRSNHIADDEAHDLSQDTFQRLYERMAGIRNADAWPFLASIAKTILYNRIRARKTLKRTATVIDIDDPEKKFPEPAAPSERDYADRQAEEAKLAQIRKAVGSLLPGQRDCMRLWLRDFQYDEIAKTLGITMDAVKSRVRDAKRILRQQLGDNDHDE